MAENDKVKAWYNRFTKKQQSTGINLRHYSIVNTMIDFGLNKRSRVLEVGCGIGSLSTLILKIASKGKLVGTDISDESIEVARQRLSGSGRAEFIVSDMEGFGYPEKFDMVVLADVLEHIPADKHPALFKTLAPLMHQDSVMVINIPNPKALDYTRQHHPEKLQIIDQSLRLDVMLRDAHAAGLRPVLLQDFALFNLQPDYVRIVFVVDGETDLKSRPQFGIILKKTKARIKFWASRF